MSLADELLADLEEAGDDPQPEEEQGEVDEVTEVTEVTMETDTQQNTVHSIAKLRDSEEVQLTFFSVPHLRKGRLSNSDVQSLLSKAKQYVICL